MNLFAFISSVLEPVRKLVDDLHTSEQEKLEARGAIVKAQNVILNKVLDYEQRLLESRTKIITSESTGQSWLQRNWRPITMMTFLALVVLDSFALLKNPLAPQAWTLLQIGLGGYVVGRSAEKIIAKYSAK